MSFIKIDRALVEHLTILTSYLGRRGFDDPYTVIRAQFEDADFSESPGRLFPELVRSGFNPLRGLTYKDLVDRATEALKSTDGSETHLPQLVSTIVDLLQHPYGQNVLAGDTLKKLRKAVLFPEEMARVSANAHQELKCGQCGKPFVEGELTTYMGDGDRAPYFACSRCVNPSYASCGKSGCDGSGPFDFRVLAKAISKSDCGAHIEKPKVDPIPEEVRRGGIIEPNPFEEAAPPAMPDVAWHAVGQGNAPGLRDRVENEVRRLRERRPGGRIGR